MKKMLEALLESLEQPNENFKSLERLANRTVGTLLFTVMEIDLEAGFAQRVFSSNPEFYPVSDRKPILKNKWTKVVIEQRKIFVANTISEIAEVFEDHELIQSLGCESCMNIPIISHDDELLGTLNCLHKAGHYTPEVVEKAQVLKLAGFMAFVLARQFQSKGEGNE